MTEGHARDADPATGSASGVIDAQEPTADAQDPIADVQDPIADVQDPIADVQDPIADVRDELARIDAVPVSERPARLAAANATLGRALAALDEV